MAWGGHRDGAGRPFCPVERKNKTIRVSDEEYELVKQFIAFVNTDKAKAEELLKSL